jgi:hypothetical protein
MAVVRFTFSVLSSLNKAISRSLSTSFRDLRRVAFSSGDRCYILEKKNRGPEGVDSFAKDKKLEIGFEDSFFL